MLKTSRTSLLLLLIVIFSTVYRAVLVLHNGFPPGADIGLHGSLIHSITQGSSTSFTWNYYHMGGGNSNTFPGYHIFAACVIFFTGLPDYLAEVLVAILFSSLLVVVAFLITRKVLNESIGLIVAFLVGLSYYDIFILLWSGYPNIVTLMLIPLTFYLLLEKSRFARLPRLVVTSLLSAAIFLTHSLSAFMFIAIIFVSLFVSLCFPRRVGVTRKEVLDWLVPIFVGGLLVSPFLVQAAPFYLNLNSPVYTGGLPDIQKLLLPIRLVPVEFVLPFLVCFFLYFVFFKILQVKLLQFPTILLVSWLIIATALTQSFIVGVYTDYERFLYFAALPLLILVGTGIFLGAFLLSKIIKKLWSNGTRVLQKRFVENKSLKWFSSCPSNQTLVALFAVILIVLVLFEASPHIFMTPYNGFQTQGQLQVMNKPGYEAIQWIKNNTPTNSVFVADALYGWWLGGFAQRPTVSAVEPFYITNSREFEPALLATRLLDTDYLIDNGLVQIREDGGYVANHNPEFLAKLNNSYYPVAFLNFNSNQTSLTLRTNGDLATVKISDLPVKEMHIENSASFAVVSITWGNEFLNFTQKATVSQGVRFVNMTETVSSLNPKVSFVSINFGLQTRGNVVAENNTSIGLEDPHLNVAGQLIFKGAQPIVTQVSGGPLEIFFNLNSQAETKINFYVTAFEYPKIGSSSLIQAGLRELFMNNTKSYADKVAELPFDVFDYRQAITNLNASYIAIRDHSQY
ncbi:MAG: hypothetical protein ACXV2C_05215, partial [Candidatus Bathyarchaeia archaeon]